MDIVIAVILTITKTNGNDSDLDGRIGRSYRVFVDFLWGGMGSCRLRGYRIRFAWGMRGGLTCRF